MNQTHRVFKSLMVAFILLAHVSLFAQLNLSDNIPLDPKLKVGKLVNGLTYYIRENKKPEQKVELRLVVNAGSILEDDDQQGLAHMSEHMAFNGTKNFKKNELISFLQNIGVGFGSDLNAYTSFDETVYILPIPTDKPGNLEKGFQVLEDWAHQVTYLDDDINGERNIILEESRLGKGASDRMFRQVYPYLFSGSKYANRLPIGLDSIVKNFQPDAIRRFYKTWYRPDLMAVIVVGDVDPAKAEDLVKKHFSSLTNPANEIARTYATVSPYTGNFGKVVTDKEATNYSVSVVYSAFPYKEATTVGEYKNDLVRNIFTTLLNTRLSELTQKENPPFIYGFGYFNSYARNYDQFNATVGVANADAAQKGLSVLMEEMEKVKRFGFTQPELDRAKLSLMAGMERAYNERDKNESENYAGEYIRNFLSNEPTPGIATEYEYFKGLVPQISLADVNDVSKLLQSTSNFFVYMTGPASGNLPTGDELVSTATSVAARTDIIPYEEKIVSANLLPQEPVAGKVLTESKDVVLGTKTWVLSNGTTVTIKKTDFKNDEILLGARRFGGINNYGLPDKYNAAYMLSVVNSMGYGNFTPTDLQKALAGKTANAGTTISALTDGFSGNSSVKDLETMLQLLYLRATAPRIDTSLFNSFVQKSKSQLAFILSNPQAVFMDTLMKTVYHNSPLAPITVPRPEYLDKIDMRRTVDIYKERFGNAFGMNFVIVGNFDEAVLKPLVEKYIGGLPAAKASFNYKDNGLRPIEGKVNLNVYKGQEDKSVILSMINGQLPYSQDLALKLAAVSEILNIKVIEDLREKIQGIYGGSTSINLEKYPYPHYTVFVQLPTGSQKVDTLLKALALEIDSIKVYGPTVEDLNKVKLKWIEGRRTGMKENNTWLNYLLTAKMEDKNVDRFLNYEKYINALTVKDIQEAANKVFTNKNVVTAVLWPEKK